MKKISSITIVLVVLSIIAEAQIQPPNVLWTQLYNTSEAPYCRGQDIHQTADGGFIIGGTANSQGNFNVILVKTNANGDTIWTQTYGEEELREYLFCFQPTTDNGYILLVDAIVDSPSTRYAKVIKTDAGGNEIWTRCFSGIGILKGGYIQQCADGGYIMVGTTAITCNDQDVYLLKMDSAGDSVWSRMFNTDSTELGECVRQTSDGGYIISGYSAGVLLIKTDSAGNSIWIDNIAGIGFHGYCVQETFDGGYVTVAGTRDPVSSSNSIRLLKTNANGDTLWTKILGGDYADFGYYILQTPEGGYIIAGETFSYGNFQQGYLVRTDANGDVLWTQALGGDNHDFFNCIAMTSDGGYVAVGSSDVTGHYNIYVARLESDAWPLVLTFTPINPPITVPAGGGSFDFEATIQNVSNDIVTFDALMDVVLPNGSVRGPLIERLNLVIPAETEITRRITQFVPQYAPGGEYTLRGKVRSQPDSTIFSNTLQFTKAFNEGESSVNNGWACYGWFGDDEAVFNATPIHFNLGNASPNPFNPTTTISFTLLNAGKIKLSVFDVTGREIATLANGWYNSGAHQVMFNGTGLASGVYFYKLTAPDFSDTKKMILVK